MVLFDEYDFDLDCVFDILNDFFGFEFFGFDSDDVVLSFDEEDDRNLVDW